MIINIFQHAGDFAENKDVARDLRVEKITPTLDKGEGVILDFENVASTTQSFIHALISDVLRTNGDEILDRLLFKNCSETVKKIISIVIDYMQQSR